MTAWEKQTEEARAIVKKYKGNFKALKAEASEAEYKTVLKWIHDKMQQRRIELLKTAPIKRPLKK